MVGQLKNELGAAIQQFMEVDAVWWRGLIQALLCGKVTIFRANCGLEKRDDQD